jgi:esterase
MQLHYKVQGNGPPLIILHGFLGSLDNWRTVSKQLSDAFQVFTIDLRNHGGSPHSDRMSYEAMSDDLHEFANQQKILSFFLLGHSMGGKVAMQFAIDHPEPVARLIVVDIAARVYESSHRPLLKTLCALDLSKYKSFSEIDDALAASIPSRLLRQFVLKNLTRDEKRGFKWKINLRAIAVNYERLTTGITAAERFSKPVLFIRGGRSDYITESDIALIDRIFPAAQVKTIANAGHWVHADAPEEFVTTVRAFLLGKPLDSTQSLP